MLVGLHAQWFALTVAGAIVLLQRLPLDGSSGGREGEGKQARSSAKSSGQPYTYWSIRNLKSTENWMMRVANMSIASELAKCWRGNMKNGFELTGSGSGFDRYISCNQYSVAWQVRE